MARQLNTGRWTSKLGTLEDIEHGSPSELEGERYRAVYEVALGSAGAQMELA